MLVERQTIVLEKCREQNNNSRYTATKCVNGVIKLELCVKLDIGCELKYILFGKFIHEFPKGSNQNVYSAYS